MRHQFLATVIALICVVPVSAQAQTYTPAECCTAVLWDVYDTGDVHYLRQWRIVSSTPVTVWSSYWANEYDLGQSHWDNGWGWGLPLNQNNKRPLGRLRNALWALRYSSPDWNEARDPSFFGYNLLTWISNMLRNADWIHPKCAKSSTCAYDAGVNASESDNEITIYLKGFYKSNRGAQPQKPPMVVWRAATLAHEARHMTPNTDHITCPWSSDNCDQSFFSYGAYAYELVFFAQYFGFGRATPTPDPNQSPPPNQRDWARDEALLIGRSRFVQAPEFYIPENRNSISCSRTPYGGCYARTPR